MCFMFREFEKKLNEKRNDKMMNHAYHKISLRIHSFEKYDHLFLDSDPWDVPSDLSVRPATEPKISLLLFTSFFVHPLKQEVNLVVPIHELIGLIIK